MSWDRLKFFCVIALRPEMYYRQLEKICDPNRTNKGGRDKRLGGCVHGSGNALFPVHSPTPHGQRGKLIFTVSTNTVGAALNQLSYKCFSHSDWGKYLSPALSLQNTSGAHRKRKYTVRNVFVSVPSRYLHIPV